MKNMTVKEAIKYVLTGNGAEYSDYKYEKVMAFIKKLPHNPSETYTEGNFTMGIFTHFYIKDYEQGWFVHLALGHYNGIIVIEELDVDSLDSNDYRVKCNKQALELVKEYYDVKFAVDIDPYYEMSDSYQTTAWARKTDMEARIEISRISKML